MNVIHVPQQISSRSRVVYVAFWGETPPPAASSGPVLRYRRALTDSLGEAKAVAEAGCAWLYGPGVPVFGKIARVVLTQGGPDNGVQLETGRWLMRSLGTWQEV